MNLSDVPVTEEAQTGHYLRNPQELVAAPMLVELLIRSPTHPVSTAERHPTPMRPGAMDFRRYPSRQGDVLVWPDGRREPINP
jgi:hypothetical protein